MHKQIKNKYSYLTNTGIGIGVGIGSAGLTYYLLEKKLKKETDKIHKIYKIWMDANLKISNLIYNRINNEHKVISSVTIDNIKEFKEEYVTMDDLKKPEFEELINNWDNIKELGIFFIVGIIKINFTDLIDKYILSIKQNQSFGKRRSKKRSQKKSKRSKRSKSRRSKKKSKF
jgi:hypothetical protein